MKEFLRKIKLIDYLTMNLEMSRQDFVDKLSAITDQGSTGVFADPFDAFSSSKNEYKGQVSFEQFKIKKRRRFFDNSFNMAIASGVFTENNGQLTIDTEINGFNNFMIFFYGILVVFYSIFIGVAYLDKKTGFFVLAFILIHGALMFSIPYFMMRRSIKRLMYDLEREFFYLTKKQ